MYRISLIFISILIFSVSSTSICSSSSIVSVVTDPVCTAWCKIRLCSAGKCKRSNGGEPECICESCVFGGSNSNTYIQPNNNQQYVAGSAGMMSQQHQYNQNGRTGFNSNGYGMGNQYQNEQRGMSNNQQNGYGMNGYNSNSPSGYGNANNNQQGFGMNG